MYVYTRNKEATVVNEKYRKVKGKYRKRQGKVKDNCAAWGGQA